jgi:hypothetical protein
MPKACVQQVQYSVFLTAHIQVYRQPALALLAEDLFAVLGVREAQVIPATASPLHARRDGDRRREKKGECESKALSGVNRE